MSGGGKDLWWPLARDIALLVGGMAGVAHETLANHAGERPYLLIIFAAMMGLPAFLPGRQGQTERPPAIPKDREG